MFSKYEKPKLKNNYTHTYTHIQVPRYYGQLYSGPNKSSISFFQHLWSPFKNGRR